MATQYIKDSDHYNKVLSKVASVKHTLWIGTADIKDLHVKVGSDSEPFLSVLDRLIRKGVSVRLIHAKEPGPIFREEYDRFHALISGLERALCPRVHFKMMIFDMKEAYVGSANLTGAGIGMKSSLKRNFEAGVLSDDPQIVDGAIEHFDSVWAGFHCADCSRKKFCGDPIVK